MRCVVVVAISLCIFCLIHSFNCCLQKLTHSLFFVYYQSMTDLLALHIYFLFCFSMCCYVIWDCWHMVVIYCWFTNFFSSSCALTHDLVGGWLTSKQFKRIENETSLLLWNTNWKKTKITLQSHIYEWIIWGRKNVKNDWLL